MITLVAGTRPNFMKIAPIWRALERRGRARRLVHTGQHFDANMSDVFFADLGLPPPDVKLGASGGSHAQQTAAVLVGVEADLVAHRPDVLVVVGDVTSTLAAALAAAKIGVPIVHVESGLRSRDWTMPEEINRILTDQLSDLLLAPSPDGVDNLLAEGTPRERIKLVGNVMIDSLKHAIARGSDVLDRLELGSRPFALATLHRPVNVDTRDGFTAVLGALEAIAERMQVVFPVHPRTSARAATFGLSDRLHGQGISAIEPLGYHDFVTLMARATVVATDSGGIQEETTALGVPCLTLRTSTERPITVTEGTNVVVGLDVQVIAREVDAILAGNGKKGRVPDGWDGNAGERVVDALDAFLGGDPPPRAAGTG